MILFEFLGYSTVNGLKGKNMQFKINSLKGWNQIKNLLGANGSIRGQLFNLNRRLKKEAQEC